MNSPVSASPSVSRPSPPTVAVIGAGPAGLIAAEVLAAGGALVTVYDHMPAPGRKFLMAGRGGLNLTHSEPFDHFMARYGEAQAHLRAAIEAFPPDALRAWCEGLGERTFVGSSGRVFPDSFKASPLLRAWLRRLAGLGVSFAFRHRWQGWNETGDLIFDTASPGGAAGTTTVGSDATVLALGGASWPRLGSDGRWPEFLADTGIEVSPLQPANAGLLVSWSAIFLDRFEGEPLKRASLSFAGQTVRGDVTISRRGLEGGPAYALSSAIRKALEREKDATLSIDLRPDLAAPDLEERLSRPRDGQSNATFLRKAAGLSRVAIGLLNEWSNIRGWPIPVGGPAALAALIKGLPLPVAGVASLDRAISTSGGLSFSELDGNFMLRRRPGVFAAGEMLDWEAPTGGYLLQASFSTGVAAARGALAWLRESTP